MVCYICKSNGMGFDVLYSKFVTVLGYFDNNYFSKFKLNLKNFIYLQ